MPRDGVITSISVFFSTTIALALIGTTMTIHGQLYGSAIPSNTMIAITGTNVSLAPALTGLVSIGDVSIGSITGLSIPVTANSRIMLVMTATATGLNLVNSATGYVSAGITIE